MPPSRIIYPVGAWLEPDIAVDHDRNMAAGRLSIYQRRIRSARSNLGLCGPGFGVAEDQPNAANRIDKLDKVGRRSSECVLRQVNI